MLMPTAGSRLFIANQPSAVTWLQQFPSGGWIEIAETEALGLLGIEWGEQSVELMDDCSADHAIEYTDKSVLRRPVMQAICGMVPADPGQLLLWQAARSTDSYPFRLVFPDGTTTREWFALVMSIGNVFDTANTVMRLQVDLKPTSDIHRSEAV